MSLEPITPFPMPVSQLRHRFGIEDFELKDYCEYDSVKPVWQELNRSYKSGELSLDWKAHCLMWDHFYSRRGGRLWILAAFQNGEVRAVFPMVREDDAAPWSLCDEFIIGREYFCPPSLIHRFASLLASIHQEDMSSFYIPDKRELFVTAPSGIVDLKENGTEWMSGYDSRTMKEYRRVRRLNEDLRVESDRCVRRDQIGGILRSQLDYWLKKKGAESESEYSYSRDKIHTDLKLMERAAEMDKLISLYFFEGERLVAANFSVRRGSGGVDDYLCLRDCSESMKRRSLGVFAILKNMDHCRVLGIRYYDLSACMAPYKEALINTELFHYHLYRPGGENAGIHQNPQLS